MPDLLGVGIVIEHEKNIAIWLHGPPNPTVQAEFVRDVVVLPYQVPTQISRKDLLRLSCPICTVNFVSGSSTRFRLCD